MTLLLEVESAFDYMPLNLFFAVQVGDLGVIEKGPFSLSLWGCTLVSRLGSLHLFASGVGWLRPGAL